MRTFARVVEVVAYGNSITFEVEISPHANDVWTRENKSFTTQANAEAFAAQRLRELSSGKAPTRSPISRATVQQAQWGGKIRIATALVHGVTRYSIEVLLGGVGVPQHGFSSVLQDDAEHRADYLFRWNIDAQTGATPARLTIVHFSAGAVS